MTEQKMLRLALPKKGRLKDDFTNTMNQAALDITIGDRLDYGVLRDQSDAIERCEVLLQRPVDALENIQDGLNDMALVGLDQFIEARERIEARGETCSFEVSAVFNSAACGLYIAAPENAPITKPAQISGKTIATSYPATLRRWLQAQNIDDVKIIARDGGIEDYVRLGLADAVCDIVQTGGTLQANGLSATLCLYRSSSVMVRATQMSAAFKEQSAAITARLLEAQPQDELKDALKDARANEQAQTWPSFGVLAAG
jgi:ATP phosphoribosyltransferase